MGISNTLVDTNFYSAAMRGDEAAIEMLRSVAHIGFCSICMGELLAGFKGGKNEKQNRQQLESFLDSPRVEVYAINVQTSEFYALVLNSLRQNGTQIPTNDIWIAAVAMQHGLRLLTYDKHFLMVPGLLSSLS